MTAVDLCFLDVRYFYKRPNIMVDSMGVARYLDLNFDGLCSFLVHHLTLRKSLGMVDPWITGLDFHAPLIDLNPSRVCKPYISA
jgi:hypothetical protein